MKSDANNVGYASNSAPKESSRSPREPTRRATIFPKLWRNRRREKSVSLAVSAKQPAQNIAYGLKKRRQERKTHRKNSLDRQTLLVR